MPIRPSERNKYPANRAGTAGGPLPDLPAAPCLSHIAPGYLL